MTDRPTQPVVERLDAVARATGRRRSQVLRDALDAYRKAFAIDPEFYRHVSRHRAADILYDSGQFHHLTLAKRVRFHAEFACPEIGLSCGIGP